MLPWVYSLIALRCRGYPLEHPALDRGIKGLDDFIIEDVTSLRLQPATSPVWDTALAMLALADGNAASAHPTLARAGEWLLGQQIMAWGDWQVKNPRTPPGGWAFELDNDRYPDVDDTALVLLALSKLPPTTAQAEARRRGLDWLLAMQSRDGGWAAFDRDNDKSFLREIPFADFMTPLDPTSPDVTAHVVELLGTLNTPTSPHLGRALAYLKRCQQADGSWYGRWGVNYIYGTSAVLMALKTAGENMAQDCIQRAASFIRVHQNQDGGWGETCQTYVTPA